jgi:hypothetical protein
MSSGDFHFHDELASLFAQRPSPGEMMTQQQQQAPASWFTDYLHAGAPGMGGMDYDLLCRALDLPLPGDDVVKRELLLVDTGGGGGGGFAAPTPTPSGGGTAPVTPNTTSSMSSSSSEAAGGAAGGGGSFGAGEEDSPRGRCKKEEGDGEESKALDKGEEDADKGKKG